MNLHEYQGKSLLKKFDVAVPFGLLATSPDEALQKAQLVHKQTGSRFFVVKAQVHAGGRGKGGGIKLARSIDEVRTLASSIIGMNLITPQTGLLGKKVSKVLIQEDIYEPGSYDIKEFYLSILLDRSRGRNIVMYSPAGGMDIEEVADKTPHLIFKEEIHPSDGVMPFQARKIAFNLGLTERSTRELMKFVPALYKAYLGCDSTLVEINPLVRTSDDRIMAADVKFAIDDNALYRHPELVEMRDLAEENPIDVEAGKHNLNFIKLDGNVGCMVNGAGLAMATMDIIKISGGFPANFLDVGGSANAKTVEAGFRIILKDPAVKAILINIFGGIVRCDRVAQGVVDAYHSIGQIHVPVIVRLQGTNAQEAKELIDNSGLHVQSAITLDEVARLVREAV